MTAPLVVIQARTSSSRLPAKALITFRGKPLAVLAAKRAAANGLDVVLATSNAPIDDLLATTAHAEGIRVVRGSLVDVLERFCDALETSKDDRLVVRLTGDNILPDGDLIKEVVTEFQKTGSKYTTTTDPKSGLPYGLSIEVMRAGDLRSAQREASTSLEREHVTPWIRNKFGVNVFQKYSHLGLHNSRVTIDTFEDLLSMHRIFPDTSAPETLPWRVVLDRLSLGLYQPGKHYNNGDLVLGTAQLGMPYGINRTSVPKPSEGEEMIRYAIANGVQWLDTARAYGKSEANIGAVLKAGWRERCRVVTKLSPMNDWGTGDCPKGVSAAAEASLCNSLLNLGGDRLDTVLLHRWDHWSAWNGAINQKLTEWKQNGLIRALGVSVQSPIELSAALEESAIEHIQLPYNLLDSRWDHVIPKVRAVRSDRRLVIHARGALLQGLLLSDDPKVWRRAHVTDALPIVAWLKSTAAQYADSSVLSLCLNWMRTCDWLDGIVVGMDDLNQLQNNLKIFSGARLSDEAMKYVRSARPKLTNDSLDPSNWISL